MKKIIKEKLELIMVFVSIPVVYIVLGFSVLAGLKPKSNNSEIEKKANQKKLFVMAILLYTSIYVLYKVGYSTGYNSGFQKAQEQQYLLNILNH